MTHRRGADDPVTMFYLDGDRLLLTFIDVDHHTEDWTWLMPNGETGVAHIELARAR